MVLTDLSILDVFSNFSLDVSSGMMLFDLNCPIPNVGASSLKRKVKKLRNRSSTGFVKNHEANVWNTVFCCLHFWELPTRTGHPRYFKPKAPRKKALHPQRKPTLTKEKVPFQLVATLGYMFSLVGLLAWWLAGWAAWWLAGQLLAGWGARWLLAGGLQATRDSQYPDTMPGGW